MAAEAMSAERAGDIDQYVSTFTEELIAQDSLLPSLVYSSFLPKRLPLVGGLAVPL